jgi:hypothetical protein
MMQSEGDSDREWHFDKRIPIAALSGIVLQIFFFGYFASTVNSSIAEHERRIVAIEHNQETTLTGPSGLSERMTRVEEKQIGAQKSLDRIETILATPAGPPQPGRDRR